MQTKHDLLKSLVGKRVSLNISDAGYVLNLSNVAEPYKPALISEVGDEMIHAVRTDATFQTDEWIDIRFITMIQITDSMTVLTRC